MFAGIEHEPHGFNKMKRTLGHEEKKINMYSLRMTNNFFSVKASVELAMSGFSLYVSRVAVWRPKPMSSLLLHESKLQGLNTMQRESHKRWILNK